MKCPFCASDDTQVRDTRPSSEGQSVRRRRQCSACGARFTTVECVQLRELSVIKRSGDRESFDREKLARSLELALRKRQVASEKLDMVINALVKRIESTSDKEVTVDSIGEMVMDALNSLDKVAYIRYASVYRNFREIKDFAEFISDADDSADQ
ncbi:MAG: transcriptional repressor NrdR [Alphaproteobacteria bacterium]|nr:transcriptional repressor NrdR [Alphaproteobacteria bacterium]